MHSMKYLLHRFLCVDGCVCRMLGMGPGLVSMSPLSSRSKCNENLRVMRQALRALWVVYHCLLYFRFMEFEVVVCLFSMCDFVLFSFSLIVCFWVVLSLLLVFMFLGICVCLRFFSSLVFCFGLSVLFCFIVCFVCVEVLCFLGGVVGGVLLRSCDGGEFFVGFVGGLCLGVLSKVLVIWCVFVLVFFFLVFLCFLFSILARPIGRAHFSLL